MVIIGAQPLANTSTSQLGHVCARICSLVTTTIEFDANGFTGRHIDAQTEPGRPSASHSSPVRLETHTFRNCQAFWQPSGRAIPDRAAWSTMHRLTIRA